MKNIKVLFFLTVLSGLVSCEGFLDEENKANNTSEDMYSTESGYESLINSCYSPLRDLHKQREVLMFATDAFEENEDPEVAAAKGNLRTFNEYDPVEYNSENEFFSIYFDLCYEAIARTNTAIDRAGEVPMSSDKRDLRVAEAKVLRALYYFYLVEQFGDIPLVLHEVKDVVVTGERVKEELVYERIISDITTSINPLPDVATEYGRVTKGMAKHLLAKIYLTRAYKSYAHADDFANAAIQATEVINTKAFGYSLLPDFAEVFEVGNEKNSEIIFAVQYSDNALYNGEGNDSHKPFGCEYSNYQGMERSSVYGRMQADVSPSKYLYSLYDTEHDSRYGKTFLELFLATIDVGSVHVGDTVIFFPRPGESWSQELIDSKPYHVVNYENYKYEYNGQAPVFPPLWKFHEPNIPYGDAGGERDFFFFRLAETYLIAAEAYLGDNKPGLGLPYFNQIRERAAIDESHKEAMRITEAELTLDMILDERARELCGEEARWMELKRCGKLVERVLLHNARAKKANVMKEYHNLRPLPHAWFERLANKNDVPQNPGFDK